MGKKSTGLMWTVDGVFREECWWKNGQRTLAEPDWKGIAMGDEGTGRWNELIVAVAGMKGGAPRAPTRYCEPASLELRRIAHHSRSLQQGSQQQDSLPTLPCLPVRQSEHPLSYHVLISTRAREQTN